MEISIREKYHIVYKWKGIKGLLEWRTIAKKTKVGNDLFIISNEKFGKIYFNGKEIK